MDLHEPCHRLFHATTMLFKSQNFASRVQQWTWIYYSKCPVIVSNRKSAGFENFHIRSSIEATLFCSGQSIHLRPFSDKTFRRLLPKNLWHIAKHVHKPTLHICNIPNSDIVYTIPDFTSRYLLLARVNCTLSNRHVLQTLFSFISGSPW